MNCFEEQIADSAVVFASDYQFAPSQKAELEHLQACSLVYCQRGCGTIMAAQQTYSMTSGCVLWIPWAVRAIYRGDNDRPFANLNLYVVPRYDRAEAMQFGVRCGLAAADSPGLFDLSLPLLQSPLALRPPANSALVDLVRYGVNSYMHGDFAAYQARLLARLLLLELHRFVAVGESRSPWPTGLQALVDEASASLDKAWTVSVMARRSGWSRATVTRQFQRHLGMSPATWICQKRVERAQAMLAGSAAPIAEIARRVGFDEPSHFSKRFKQVTGHSPRAYRASSSPWS